MRAHLAKLPRKRQRTLQLNCAVTVRQSVLAPGRSSTSTVRAVFPSQPNPSTPPVSSAADNPGETPAIAPSLLPPSAGSPSPRLQQTQPRALARMDSLRPVSNRRLRTATPLHPPTEATLQSARSPVERLAANPPLVILVVAPPRRSSRPHSSPH